MGRLTFTNPATYSMSTQDRSHRFTTGLVRDTFRDKNDNQHLKRHSACKLNRAQDNILVF